MRSVLRQLELLSSVFAPSPKHSVAVQQRAGELAEAGPALHVCRPGELTEAHPVVHVCRAGELAEAGPALHVCRTGELAEVDPVVHVCRPGELAEATPLDSSYCYNRDSLIDIATGYGVDGWSSIPGMGKFFPFSTASRPAVGLTQPPIQ
jgi:hypothetical protein